MRRRRAACFWLQLRCDLGVPLAVLCMALGICRTSLAARTDVGAAAPAFSLTVLDDDKTVRLADYLGQPLVLVYWRTAQERSLQAVEEAQEIVQKHESKGVRMLTVVSGEEPQVEVTSTMQTRGIRCPTLIDKERVVFHDYGVVVYPTTFLIDAKGAFAAVVPGCPPTYKNSLDSELRKLLGGAIGREKESMDSGETQAVGMRGAEATRLHNLALTLAQSAQFDAALDAAKRSVAAGPAWADSRVLMGFLQLETSDAAHAIESFRYVLEIEPRNHEAMAGLGRALIATGEVDGAITLLKPRLAISPCPVAELYELGRAYELKGDLESARTMYRTAIEKVLGRQILPSKAALCQ